MRLSRRLLCLPALALLAATSAAQFDILPWTVTAPGPGHTDFTFTVDTLTVSGPSYADPCLSPIDAYASATIPFDATVSFRVDFTPDDFGPGYDWPVVALDGVVVKHLTESCQGCEVVVEVDAGQKLGLGNHTVDCLMQASVSIFSELKIVPRAGSSPSFGIGSFENYGHAVARLGDLDADGIDDLAIGAPRATVGTPFCGRVTVLSGADGSTLFTLGGVAGGEYFGFALAAAGDVDGDRVPDLLVGAPFAALTAGQVRLFSGAGGAPLGSWTGDDAGDQLGSAVASVGDADGDGVPDFVAGAPKGDLGGPDTGYARVYSGATREELTTVVGSQTSEGIGAALAGAGDLDGNGVPEMILGAPGYSQSPNFNLGRVTVRSALTGAALWIATGATDGARLGSSVASVGDLDGDGLPDVAAGAPTDDASEPTVGRANVYSGATGALLFSAAGGHTGDQFGTSVAGAGDVDEDGRLDVVVGAPGETWTDATGPRARARCPGRDGTLIGVAQGDASGAKLGWAVSSAGDTDGDGRAEIVAGAPGADDLGTDAGQATILSLEVIWADFGQGLAGALGTPKLVGTGLLVGGKTIKLRLQNVPATLPAALIAGLTNLSAPFKGGILVPSPSIIVTPLITTPTGLTLSALWPNPFPSGLDLYLQFWIADPAGPAGFSASNAVRGTTP